MSSMCQKHNNNKVGLDNDKIIHINMHTDKYFISQIKSNGVILSPNNWLKRVGAFVKNGQLVLPHECILIPLSAASRAIETFNSSTEYTQKLELSLLISLSTRIAETAFYNKFAKWFGNESKIKMCGHCIRNSEVFNNGEIKKYRNLCNEKIIHAMENQSMVNSDDLIYAIKYYDEVLKLPLIDPIKIITKFEIKVCDKCLEKNGIKK